MFTLFPDIFFSLDAQGVGVMLDLCGRSWDEPDAAQQCLARAAWTHREGEAGEWVPSGPLQVGGLAHPPPLPQDHGWLYAAKGDPLEGCVSHVTVNGQVSRLRAHALAGGPRAQARACSRSYGRLVLLPSGINNIQCLLLKNMFYVDIYHMYIYYLSIFINTLYMFKRTER